MWKLGSFPLSLCDNTSQEVREINYCKGQRVVKILPSSGRDDAEPKGTETCVCLCLGVGGMTFPVDLGKIHKIGGKSVALVINSRVIHSSLAKDQGRGIRRERETSTNRQAAKAPCPSRPERQRCHSASPRPKGPLRSVNYTAHFRFLP